MYGGYGRANGGANGGYGECDGGAVVVYDDGGEYGGADGIDMGGADGGADGTLSFFEVLVSIMVVCIQFHSCDKIVY